MYVKCIPQNYATPIDNLFIIPPIIESLIAQNTKKISPLLTYSKYQ